MTDRVIIGGLLKLETGNQDLVTAIIKDNTFPNPAYAKARDIVEGGMTRTIDKMESYLAKYGRGMKPNRDDPEYSLMNHATDVRKRAGDMVASGHHAENRMVMEWTRELGQLMGQRRRVEYIPKTVCLVNTCDTGQGVTVTMHRGYGQELWCLAKKAGIKLKYVDQRVSVDAEFPELYDRRFNKPVVLNTYQKEAQHVTNVSSQGWIKAPPGAGKSLTAMNIMKHHGQASLVVVHRDGLAKQWKKEVKRFLGLDVPIIGGGSKLYEGEPVAVAMVQTIVQMEPRERARLLARFGLVFVDECHHGPSESYLTLFSESRSKLRFGLSAEESRSDGLGFVLERVIGPQLIEVERGAVVAQDRNVPVDIQPVNLGKMDQDDFTSYNAFISAVVEDKNIQEALADFIVSMVCDNPVKFLVLTDRVKHAEDLAEAIAGEGLAILLAHGKLKKADKDAAMASLGVADGVVGTTGLLGEGIDVPGWTIEFLTLPIASKGKLVQAIGRVARTGPGKTRGVVYDCFVDHPIAWSSWKKRRKVYKDNGHLVKQFIKL